MKKRSDGRYRKTITDPRTGKKVYFYGETEREVYKKILEYTTKAEKGRTFAEVADEWWKANEPRWAVQTIKPYIAAYKRSVEYLGDKGISDITARDIYSLLRILASQGYRRKTLSNQRTIVNQVMAYAMFSGEIKYNPCASVQIPSCTDPVKRSSASVSDEDVVKASADVWVFPVIALYSGLRKGEILALQWRDIDFSKKMIRVSKSISHDGDRPCVKSPKTKESIRVVPLLAPLEEILFPIKGPADNYIVSDGGATPLTKRRYETLMSRYKAVTGVSCTAHQLRHSFATIAIQNGVDAKTVQTLMGHRQISTTLDIYTDLREESMRRAGEVLNDAFTLKKRW